MLQVCAREAVLSISRRPDNDTEAHGGRAKRAAVKVGRGERNGLTASRLPSASC